VRTQTAKLRGSCRAGKLNVLRRLQWLQLWTFGVAATAVTFQGAS